MIKFLKLSAMDNGFIFFDENDADYSLLKHSERIKVICDSKHGIGACGAVFVMPPEDRENHSCKMVFYNKDGKEAEANAPVLSCVAHLYLSQRGWKDFVVVESSNRLYRVTQAGSDKTVFVYETEFELDDPNRPKDSEVLSLVEKNGKIFSKCSVQEVAYGYLTGLLLTKLENLC